MAPSRSSHGDAVRMYRRSHCVDGLGGVDTARRDDLEVMEYGIQGLKLDMIKL
jgi:hypothetical protein